MPLPICTAILGFLCLTGEAGGPPEKYRGIYGMDTVKARKFDFSIVYSDFYQTYHPNKMDKVCEDEICFIYEVTYQKCDISLVLFPYIDVEELGPTGVSYDLSARTGSGLEQAISQIYVIEDKKTQRTLFSLSRLIDAGRAAETCRD